MKIVLILNYQKDKQESMLRFGKMLGDGFQNFGHSVSYIYPKSIFGFFFSNTNVGIGKWLGYIDKWIVFPIILKIRTVFVGNNTLYHVCDHSNAPYLRHLPKDKSSITCHDVLAIRGAFGYADAYVSASKAGVYLQKWILRNLLNASKVAAVSLFTLDQLNDLGQQFKIGKSEDRRVIYNGFNASFKKYSLTESKQILKQADISISSPYLFHVGSALPRKNRLLLVKMLHAIRHEWNGMLVMAGEKLDIEVAEFIRINELDAKVLFVNKPTHEILNALYCGCDAFIFPSLSEGFGWPIIEAQACGVPVVTSNISPMTEIAGAGGIFADPNDFKDFADKTLSVLRSDELRENLKAKAYKNIDRFTTEKMISQYLSMCLTNTTKE